MDERGVIPVALLLLGDAQLSLKKIDDAKRTWQRLEAIRAGDALSQRLAGAYQMSRDEAAQNRANAVRVQESGIAALRGGYATVARKELGDAVRRDPSLARGWFYLGEARRIAGDPAAARTAYAKAVELVPHDGRALDALRRLDAAAK